MAEELAEQYIRDFAWIVTSNVSQLSDETLVQDMLLGDALKRYLEAKYQERIAEFDRREIWQADGATSAANWLAAHTGSRPSVVRRQVRIAQSVAANPTVAAVAPQLSSEHLELLVSCRSDTTVEAYERDEQRLIDAAGDLSVEKFAQLVRAWRTLADPDGSAAARRHDAEAARVHLSRTLNGWWILSGVLPPEDGEVLHAALEAGVNRRLRAAGDGDPSIAGRPVASWRADALVDLAGQSMRREPSDQSVPDRYRIGLVLCPSEVDQAPAGALCDSTVYRLVRNAPSETLDVGRSTPTWPVGLRRAITARDRGCIFPGCDRPPSWCDIHHCTPWAKGGDTSLDNGALLCRAHHTFVHRQGWTVVIPAARGAPEVHRPDGSRFVLRPGPPLRPPDSFGPTRAPAA